MKTVQGVFNRPIKQQLIMLVMVVSGILTLILSLAFMTNDIINLRSSLVNELSLVSRIIGTRVTSSLAFNQPEKAQKDLQDLEAKPSILLACVYRKDGTLFAQYNTDASQHSCSQFPNKGIHYTLEDLTFFYEITSNGESKGAIYLVSDLRDIYNQLYSYIITMLVLVSAVLIIGYFIISFLQKIITRPIKELADAAHRVKAGDYSVRAQRFHDDEIGDLTDAFNGMMDMAEGSKEALERQVSDRTAKLREAKEEAEKANRLKTLWIQNIGHELRTPIHNVNSYAEFGLSDSLDEKTPRKELHKFFERIFEKGTRLAILINDLLDFGKLEAGKMNFHFAKAKLQEIVELVAKEVDIKLMEKNLQLVIKKPNFATELSCDENRINQVVTNILTNAAKFTTEGSTITVSFQEAQLDDKQAIQVAIKDEGVGIPDDELEDIFDTFRQSSKTATGAGGTGLGLSISREIVNAHQGKIWAENNDGPGATFFFTLPAEYKPSNQELH